MQELGEVLAQGQVRELVLLVRLEMAHRLQETVLDLPNPHCWTMRILIHCWGRMRERDRPLLPNFPQTQAEMHPRMTLTMTQPPQFRANHWIDHYQWIMVCLPHSEWSR